LDGHRVWTLAILIQKPTRRVHRFVADFDPGQENCRVYSSAGSAYFTGLQCE
jgi:hypothetical protein